LMKLPLNNYYEKLKILTKILIFLRYITNKGIFLIANKSFT